MVSGVPHKGLCRSRDLHYPMYASLQFKVVCESLQTLLTKPSKKKSDIANITLFGALFKKVYIYHCEL